MIRPAALAVLSAGLLLSACAPDRQGFPPLSVSAPPAGQADKSPSPTAPAPDPAAPRPDLASCGASGLGGLIGQPAAALPSAGTWGALRLLSPGQAMTMDYSPNRLNVSLDEAGVILALSCG